MEQAPKVEQKKEAKTVWQEIGEIVVFGLMGSAILATVGFGLAAGFNIFNSITATPTEPSCYDYLVSFNYINSDGGMGIGQLTKNLCGERMTYDTIKALERRYEQDNKGVRSVLLLGITKLQ